MSLDIGTNLKLVLFRCTIDSIWWPALASTSKQELIQRKDLAANVKLRIKMLKLTKSIAKDKSLMGKELLYISPFNAKNHPENNQVLHVITKEQQEDLLCDFFVESFVYECEDGPRGKAVDDATNWADDSDDELKTEDCAASPGGKMLQDTRMISKDSSSSDSSTNKVKRASTKLAVQKEEDDERKMPAVQLRNEVEDQLLCTPPNQTRNAIAQPVAVAQAAITNAPEQSSTSSDDADKMQVTPANAKDVAPPKTTGSTSKKKKRSSKKRSFNKDEKSKPWSNALDILTNHFGWNVVPGQGGFVPTYYIPGGLEYEYEENGLEYVKKNWKKNVDYYVTEEAAKKAVFETYGWTGPEINFPDKNSDWQEMYSTLEFIHQIKYNSNGTARCKKEFMGFKKSSLTRNVHYFETEDDIKEFAHKTYGWVGPVDKPYSPGKRRTPRRNDEDYQLMPFTPATLVNSPRKDNEENPMKQNEKITKTARTTSAKKKNKIRSKTLKTASPNNMIEDVDIREEPQKHDEWVVMVSKLESIYNLGYYKQSGRIKKDLQDKPINELEENKDYFNTQDDLKEFAYKTYGWVGPADKPYVPLGNGRRTRANMDVEKKNAKSTMKKRPSKDEESLKSNKKNKTKSSSKTNTPSPLARNVNIPLSGDSKSSFSPTGMDSFSLTSDEQEEQWANLNDHIIYHMQIEHKQISGCWGWIKVEFKDRKIKELKENEDYFANDDALKTFVHKRYGWIGPKENRFVPFTVDEGGSRRRRNVSVQPVTKEVKISRATNKVDASKSSDKKKSKKEKKSSKKSMKVISAPYSSQPHDEEVSFDTLMDDELSSNDDREYLSLGNCNRESHWNEVRAVVCEDLGLDHQRINGENGFIKATYQPIKQREIMDLRENIDYFASEDALKQYVHETYGWIGPEHNRYSPPIIAEGRRRRRATESKKDISPGIVKEVHSKSKAKQTANEKKGSKVNKMHKSGKVQENHDTTGKLKKRKSSAFSKEKSKKQKVSQTKTLKEKLNECINNMGVEESDDYFFEGDETCDKKERIIAFFKHENPSFLYVCGRPGTGKTTMVRHCVNQFPDANIKFVKATDFTASSESLYNEISSMISKKRYSGDVGHLEKELGKIKKGHIFLVIDEIDFLWSKSNNNDSVFSTVLGWASNPEMRLAVIGVSNSIGDNAAKAVHNLTKTFDEIIFQPFTTEQLQEMLYARLGSNKSLVDEKAVTFLSRKVGQNKGDARECLRIMNEVLVAAVSKLDEAALSSIEDCSALVKIPDIMKMLKNSGYNMFEQIQKLPSNTKTVLCIATALSQVSEAWKVISVNTLQEYCAENYEHFEGWSTQQFKDAIEMLEDGGMINKVDRDTDGNVGGNWYFKLGVQLEDVNAAVEKSLLQEGTFYKRMFEYVKKNDINNNMGGKL